MNPIKLRRSAIPIIGQGELSEFDASANAGLFVSAPRWPLLASAPATVVNGQRFRLAEAGRKFGREYLGVGGAWVPQDDVTMGLYCSDGAVWYRDLSQDICEIPIKATGTGSGVAAVRITSSVDTVMQTCGLAKFYTDAAGTLGESQSVSLSAGVDKLIYLRLSSGTCYLLVDKCSSITKFGTSSASLLTEATNAPTLNNFNTRYILNNATVVRFAGNLMTVSGSTFAWTNATVVRFDGNLMTVSGPTFAWTNATVVWFVGNLMTVSGPTFAWTNATIIWFEGDLITVSGSTFAWTNATIIWFLGNLMTVSGSTFAWTNATIIRFVGNLMTVSGPTFAWANATYIWFGGSLIQLAYVTKTWRSSLSRLYISSSSMTSSMVDQALIDIDASGTTAIGEKSINLSGRCGAVTSASTAARASLAAKAFTVTVNL